MRGGRQGKASLKVTFGLRPKWCKGASHVNMRAELSGRKKSKGQDLRWKWVWQIWEWGAREGSSGCTVPAGNARCVLEVWNSEERSVNRRTWKSSACQKHGDEDQEDRRGPSQNRSEWPFAGCAEAAEWRRPGRKTGAGCVWEGAGALEEGPGKSGGRRAGEERTERASAQRAALQEQLQEWLVKARW